MVATTLNGVMLTGDHASRPAASAVAKGTLYSCTTHSLIYQSDASSWSTWATLGTAASGSITSSGYTQSTARLLGRTTASSGAIEEITVGSGLSLSAGSLTATGGSGTSLNPGSSFPGSPSTNDLCFRTDRGLLYFYDGTRWLTVQIFVQQLSSVQSITATSAEFYGIVQTHNYDMYLLEFIADMFSGSLSGSAFWTVTLDQYDDGTKTNITSVSNVSGTNNVFLRKTATINALLGTSVDSFAGTWTKTSTPAGLSASCGVTYRLVG